MNNYDDTVRFERVKWGEILELRAVDLGKVEDLAGFEARVGDLIVHCLGQYGLTKHSMRYAEDDEQARRNEFPNMHYVVKLAALYELHGRIRAESGLGPVFVHAFTDADIPELSDVLSEREDIGELD